MSTILDVLRKAQEDARSRSSRQRIDPGDLPDLVLDRDRPRRRFRPWMLAPIALVVLAGAAGGIFLTDGARVPRARRGSQDGGAVAAKATAPEVLPTSPEIPAGAIAKAAPAPAVQAPAAPPASASAPAESPPSAAAPTAERAGAPAPAKAAAVAAPGATPRVAATRIPVGRPATEEHSLAGAPVGVPRPPTYLEKRVGPSGKAETHLLPVERPRFAGDEPRVVQPPAPQQRKPPLVRHSEELPAGEAEPAPGAEAGDPSVVPGDGPDPRGPVPPRTAREPAPEVRRLPSGLPEVEVNIVQWSPAADRRFAFVRVDGSTMVKVREGDEVGGLRVVRIHPQGVELAQDDGRWILRTD